MAIIVSIEGNIGTGKSTLIKMMENFKTSKPIIFLQEPVDEWTKITDKEGEPILTKFYADSKKWAFSFQMMAYISRLAILRKTIRENPDSIILCERSLLTDKWVFAKMLHDDGIICDIDYKIYMNWFDEFFNDVRYDKIVYLRTDPKCSSERIKKRAREGENIELSYLEKCHKYHDDWILNDEICKCEKMIISADENREFNIESYSNIISSILKFIETVKK